MLKQNARVDVFDERGRSGLHLAAELGHDAVLDLLLKHNAFVNVRNKSGKLLDKLDFWEFHLNQFFLIGMTPLHLAAKFGNSIFE